MHCTTGEFAGAHARLDRSFCETVHSLFEAFERVPDTRHRRGRRYSAAVVLTLLLAGKMAGESHLAGIAEWVRHRKDELGCWLPLKDAPCANTYRYVCAHVDAQTLLDAAAAVLGAARAARLLSNRDDAPEMPLLRHLACDGKELRGSYRLTAAGVQEAQGVLGIYDTASGQMEALLAIESKGYEPKALKMWLTQQNSQRALAGFLVTADALHTQRSVCQAVQDAGGDYLLIVKRNQNQLLGDIVDLFSTPTNSSLPERSATRFLSGHGRTAHLTIRVSTALNHFLADDWTGIQQVFCLERTVTRRGRQGTTTTVEQVYGFTSLPASRSSPQQLLDWVQAHWRIENRSHWRRDASLGEDRLQLSNKTAAITIATLNCILLALFDFLSIANCCKAMRHFNAYPAHAMRLLCQSL